MNSNNKILILLVVIGRGGEVISKLQAESLANIQVAPGKKIITFKNIVILASFPFFQMVL